MNSLGFIERSWPAFRCARSDISELHGAGVHPFDEFVRERLQRRGRSTERTQSLIGETNVETGVRLVGPPIPRGDLLNVIAPAGGSGSEPAPGCDSIGNFQDEITHA